MALQGSAWSAAEAGFDDVAPMHLGSTHASTRIVFWPDEP